MNLYESISQRKSCRKFNLKPIEPGLISQIESAINEFDALYPDKPLNLRFVNKIKGNFCVEAPSYLIISGQGKSGEAENLGFLFEQLVLWFDAMDLGCVWQGSAKDAENGRRQNDIIALAFGSPAEPIHRAENEFKRKPIDAITNAPDDICIKAVRQAPSGLNTQPWYFEKQNEKVLVYKKSLKPPVSLVYKHSDVDMGIALCHYAVACKQIGKPFEFSRELSLPDKPGFVPFGIIK